MRVVVVSSVRAGRFRPKANSRVVLPPPPTRDRSDRRPSPSASAAPARLMTRTFLPVGQVSRILRASTTITVTRTPRMMSRLKFFTARSVVVRRATAARGIWGGREAGPRRRLPCRSEVSECLVGSPAFKAGGTGDPRPAGSIPVHLRHD